jgi:hypothetical protein
MVVAAIILAAAVGVVAYNAGVAQGVEQAGKVITLPSGAVQMPMYYWHRPHGFFFIPLIVLAFFLLAVRGCGRRWHQHHGCYDRTQREENPGRG